LGNNNFYDDDLNGISNYTDQAANVFCAHTSGQL